MATLCFGRSVVILRPLPQKIQENIVECGPKLEGTLFGNAAREYNQRVVLNGIFSRVADPTRFV